MSTNRSKRQMMEWALPFVRERSSGGITFNPVTHMVCIDENGFYLVQQGQKYLLLYLYDGEDMSHKSHIKEVMSLAAVARPRHDTACCQQKI